MAVHIRVALALGLASTVFCQKHLPVHVKIKDVLPFGRGSRADFKTLLKSLSGKNSATFTNERLPDSKNSEMKSSTYFNEKLAQNDHQSFRMPSASLRMLEMHDINNSRLPQDGAEKQVTKRHIYRSCCECCRTQIMMIQLAPLTSNLTQIISVGTCPQISRERECRNCQCTLETRIFWILEETTVPDLPVTTSRYRFVPVEYPGHCVHANSG